MTYSEKLKDPRWQRRRLEIMERADFSCEMCAAKDKTLHVHHKVYIKGHEPWEYEDSGLECLCEDCHEQTHHWRDVVKRFGSFLQIEDLMRLAGYSAGLFLIDPVAVVGNMHKVNADFFQGVGNVFYLTAKEVEGLVKDDELCGMAIFDFKVAKQKKTSNG